jgi:hypothetical protein
MVAPEPDEPLLLYIAAIAKVMSMVLVVERQEPHQHQAPKGAHAANSGCQDPDPAGRLGDKEVAGSQRPKPTLSFEPQVRSQLPEAASSPRNQDTTRS